MKKLNYLLLGLAGLTLASCSQDDLVGPAQGDGNFNITVKLPGNAYGTRALSDGKTAENLLIAVYDTQNDNAYIFEDQASFGPGELSTNVSMNLPSGKTYTIAFFAVSKAGMNLYDFDAEGKLITVDYTTNYLSADNLKDAYDCFFNVGTYTISNTSTPTTVTLSRPVGQVNWGTSDLNKAAQAADVFGANGTNIVTNITVNNAYSQFDILTGEVTGDAGSFTISGLASPASSTGSDKWAFPVQPSKYQYIAMQYLLAPQTSTVYDFTMNADNSGGASGEISNEVIVSSAPVQANYRTNIYGSLLTSSTEFTVTKDPIYTNQGFENHVADTAQALMDALQEGGYVVLNADVTLPKPNDINNTVILDLNGHTITYDGDDEGCFYINPGGNLTINGNGKVLNTKYYTPIFVDGGEVTINGGDYWAVDQTGQIVYVYEGNAYINGGSFALENMEQDKALYYPVNCEDESYRNGTAHISVSGGMFLMFDPGASPSEGSPKVNFLAEGYQSVEAVINGETWYVVVPKGVYNVPGNQASLAEMLNKASSSEEVDVYLLPGVDYSFNGVTFQDGAVINIYGESPETSQIGAYTVNPVYGYISTPNCTLNFKNIALNVGISPGNSTSMKFENAAIVTFENCYINGEYHAVSGNQTFNDCTFNFVPESTTDGKRYNAWVEGGTANYENCTFNNTQARGILVYNGSANSPAPDLNVTGCSFYAAETKDNGAVEIHSQNFTGGGTLTISNSTCSPNFEMGIWHEIGANDATTTTYTVTVNEKTVQTGSN